MRNVDRMLNKKGPMEYMVEVNIYYKNIGENRDRCNWGVKVEYNLGNAIAGSLQS